jgi:hypothetical protein
VVEDVRVKLLVDIQRLTRMLEDALARNDDMLFTKACSTARRTALLAELEERSGPTGRRP